MTMQHDRAGLRDRPGRRSHRPGANRVAALWNGAKTAALLAGMAALFLYVGGLFGPTGTVIGAGLGLATVAGSWWFSDRLALRAAGARPLRPREAPGIAAAVKSLAARAGIPTPSLWVIDDPQPNAFATGRNPDHAGVAVTTGLLRQLPAGEVEAVLAHEIGHIAHRDTLIVSVAAAIGTAISALANLVMWLPFFGYHDDEDGGANPLALLVAAMLAPIAATLVQLAISRTREYDADRASAELLGSGRPLANALARIDRAATATPMAIPPAQAAHYIVNPLAGGGINRLFATHPLVQDRIRRLLDPIR
jgi:heat shock protein HtpX